MPMKCAILLAAAAVLAAAAAGCASHDENRYPPNASTDTPLFAGLVAMEDRGKYLQAATEYERIADDSSLDPHERVRAMLRAARCHEESKNTVSARAGFVKVISLPAVAADEARLPFPGQIGIHLRIQAEEGLSRIGIEPCSVYAQMTRTGVLPQRIAAVRSLGRMRNGRGRPALEQITADPKEDASLRREAAEALEALDSGG